MRDSQPLGELTFHGVWAIQFEVSYLSDFLKTLHLGSGGKVYVVTRSGLVVGHPAGEVTEVVNGVKQIAHAKKYDDAMFEKYNKILDLKGEHKKKFQTGKYQNVSKRLKRSCAAEVEALYPGSKFFVPEV